MQTIHLKRFPFFNPKFIERLNYHFSVKTDLDFMPHELASAIGCSYDEAKSLLFYLYLKNIAKGYLAIYHKLDEGPLVPFMYTQLEQGFPELPTICSECGRVIEHDDELLYDMVFSFSSIIYFDL